MEEKKNKKLLLIICTLLVILLLGGGGYYYYTNYYNKDDSKEQVTKPNLEDDFYEYINYVHQDGALEKATNVAATNLMSLIQEIEMGSEYKDPDYYTFFEMYDDMEERDKLGISELKPYFDEIDNADTLDKFSDILIKVTYDLGVVSFLNFSVMPDFYDNSKNVILFSPMQLEKQSTFMLTPDLPSGLEFFTNSEYNTYKKAFENARIKYFKQYGYDEEKATKLSNDITDFAKIIQNKSVALNELNTNFIKYYKNYSKKELKSLINNLPIDKLLEKYQLSNYQYFAILDNGHIKELDNYYKEDNLPLMKEILKLLILEDFASLHTSSDYAKILADTLKELAGQSLNYQFVLAYYEIELLKPQIMGSYLNTKYDELYFTEDEKKEIIELINKIKKQYTETIKKSDWLDDETKKEAIKKLDTMEVNVGFTKNGDDTYVQLFANKENGGSLVSNYILLNKYISGNISKEIKEVKHEQMSQFEANAYYNPQNNSINFLSGFREVYRGTIDKNEIYALVGTIIGHEISHAFDNNGSQFDEKGNIKNWWTDKDKTAYEDLRKKISNYYSQYEIYGMKINGDLTVGENIADLAAVKTIISIMESENATNDDYKNFFETYAKLWDTTNDKTITEMQILTDTHAPNKIRVNAVLSSTDKFYEVYGIKEGDKMYVAKENRVGLW